MPGSAHKISQSWAKPSSRITTREFCSKTGLYVIGYDYQPVSILVDYQNSFRFKGIPGSTHRAFQVFAKFSLRITTKRVCSRNKFYEFPQNTDSPRVLLNCQQSS